MKTSKKNFHRVTVNGNMKRLVKIVEIKDFYKTLVFENIKTEFPNLQFDYDSLFYDDVNECWHINTKTRTNYVVPVTINDSIDICAYIPKWADYNDHSNELVLECLRLEYPEYNFDDSSLYYNPVVGVWKIKTI